MCRQPVPEAVGGHVRGQCSDPVTIPGEPLGPKCRHFHMRTLQRSQTLRHDAHHELIHEQQTGT